MSLYPLVKATTCERVGFLDDFEGRQRFAKVGQTKMKRRNSNTMRFQAIGCLCGLLLLVVACGGTGSTEPGSTEAGSSEASSTEAGDTEAASSDIASPFIPPETEEGDEGELVYVDPETIDAESAEGLAPGTSSPEAAVTHFYASRIRGDDLYREVLVPDRSERLESTLERLDEWTFTRFRLVEKQERSPGSLWVTVWFEIEVGDDVDSGEDEVGVREVDGLWLIESVPM